MQNRAIFRIVDLVAAEHCVAVRFKTAGARQGKEQLQCFARHALLAEIKVHVERVHSQLSATLWILFKDVAQMRRLDFLGVRQKGLPFRAAIKRRDWGGGRCGCCGSWCR